MIRAKNNVAYFTCCILFQCFDGSPLMFVIVHSYIYFSFFLVVLKYGAGRLEKVFKSNKRELLKMPLLKFD